MELTSRGAEILKCTPNIMKLVNKELMVAPLSPQDPFPKKFRVYAETPTKVIVPVHWARKALAHLPQTDSRAPGQSIACAFAGTLRPELSQPEAAAAVQSAWRQTGGALLALPPGYGKTCTALYLAAQLQRKTLVVVHKDFLMQQWVDRIAQYVPGATVSLVRGDACDTSGDFVVAMLQTLVSRKYPASTFEACGLVVVDECQHIAAAAFSTAMFGLAARYTLGLSATPDRRDGLGRVVGWFVGDTAFRLRRENQATTAVKTVKYTCPRYSDPPPTNRRGDMCFTSTLTLLASDERRTAVVAGEAVGLARSGRDVLVLSHRRQHCSAIAAMVAAEGVGCSTYLGGDKSVPTSQVIVATYALTSEGFDCPRLTALVLATPASDVEQSCGRVMRGSAAASAVIVDVVDQWGVCHAQHAKRRALYKRSGFRVAHDAQPAGVGTSFAFVDDSL